ncbi:MAG TPA: biotin/lipoyl-containing protein, partial [Rhodanobacteraceae bacterium]|nr:biotin/lipoyl-containing protein [Rhodanobacteraceae bacterium]
MATIELKVPAIGDFSDVPVIEVLVKVGDKVEKDQSLLTLESAKATMEVPASAAGVIKELRVKEGDSVSEGSVIAVVEAAGAVDREPKAQPASSSPSPLMGEGRGEGERRPALSAAANPSPLPSPTRGEGKS